MEEIEIKIEKEEKKENEKKKVTYSYLKEKGITFKDCILGHIPYNDFLFKALSVPFSFLKFSYSGIKNVIEKTFTVVNIKFKSLAVKTVTVAIVFFVGMVNHSVFSLEQNQTTKKDSSETVTQQEAPEVNSPTSTVINTTLPPADLENLIETKVKQVMETEKTPKDKKDAKQDKNKNILDASIMPLSKKEITEIKEKAFEYKELLEKDRVKEGIIRKIFVNTKNVYRIYSSVGYSTFICFFDKFTLSDVVIGSTIFNVDLYPERNCLILFPTSPFKNTNLTVFINKEPYHFLVQEVFNKNTLDFRVDVEKSPEKLPDISLLVKMLYKENVPDSYSSYCRIVNPKCNNQFCKSNVESVLEVLAPVYIKGYKIKKNGNISAVSPYFEAETDNYKFLFFTEKTSKVIRDNEEYEIY